MPKRQTSYLFMVRLWLEDMGHGQTEWRGQLQLVKSGEASYFHNWPGLVEQLLRMLPGSAADGPEKGGVASSDGDSGSKGSHK